MMSFGLIVNMTSLVCCFMFFVFLFVLYFSKKNVDNIENKIYRRMLFCNGGYIIFLLIFTLLDILVNLGKVSYDIYDFLIILNKIGIVFLSLWFILLCFYIFIVVNEKKEKFTEHLNHNSKKYFIGLYVFLFIYTIILFMEKFDLSIYSGVENTALISFNAVVILSILLDLIMVITNFKKINKKKILPIVIIFPLLSLGWTYSIVVVINSGNELKDYIVFFYIVITLINYLMFFTIENPDLKMINELTLAKNQAEKANNAKSDFLSSMSHELRTPLNAIVGLTQTIIYNDNVDEMHTDGKDILKASNNLIELVDSILEINKLDSNTMEVVETIYNPRDLFNDLEKLTKLRIDNKPIELRMRISDDLPQNLKGDKKKLRTIINNLLTNAVKYSEKGYVDFIIDSVVADNKCNLRITVSDTGRGISEDQLDKLFTRFYRREEDKDSDIEGTGLGLAITKSLVELMNGKITVNSTEGMGSTFMVTLSQNIVEENVETI